MFCFYTTPHYTTHNYYIEIGTPYNAQKHEAIEVRNDPSVSESNGLILESVSSGFVDSEGEVLRRAKVIVSKKEQLPTPPPAAVPVVESEEVSTGSED